MSSRTICDKCGNTIKTGYQHRLTLRFLNEIGKKEDPSELTTNWEADLCGICMKRLFIEYFSHLADHINIEEYDLDF